jgi:hypothetical protein
MARAKAWPPGGNDVTIRTGLSADCASAGCQEVSGDAARQKSPAANKDRLDRGRNKAAGILHHVKFPSLVLGKGSRKDKLPPTGRA